MPAPESVVRLVERFGNELSELKKPDYYEAELCTQFLNPLIEALGWDVKNERGKFEVRQQKRLGLAKADEKKAPDYGFSIGGELKFYLDAKRPSVPVATDMASVRQIRRYGWNKDLLISVVSDFEHLAIYDTRFPVLKKDTPDTALACRRFGFRDFVDHWDEIVKLLGRDQVAAGSIEHLVGHKKKGVKPVDKSFLDDLSSWRKKLASDIHGRNEVSDEQLNMATQRILDRIIFIRVCEDRGIEHRGILKDAARHDGTWKRLLEIFKKADAQYDSGLFYFGGRGVLSELPDTVTPTLTIGDVVLSEIILGLYDPAPYDFSIISPEILGSVYEQFLGETIVSDGRGVRVEKKPEVKKAGGVYYTPAYIVDRIVRETVGGLLENKMPKDVASITILDPACGSGSFLIGAYQYLIDWHLEKYQALGETSSKENGVLREMPDGTTDLTIQEKQRILASNIFGVDLDARAVEVAKLSLSLKLLEKDTRPPQLVLEGGSTPTQRVLPDLGGNIKQGNSLIASDISLDPSDLLNVHAFDWDVQFAEVKKSGGFDAIIGNPPYIRIQILRETDPASADYLQKHYLTAGKGNYDIYVCFVEKALSLLGPNGRHGYILPHKFFNAKYGEGLRRYLANGQHVSKIIHFGEEQVFPHVSTYTCLLFTQKSPATEMGFEKVEDLVRWRAGLRGPISLFPSSHLTEKNWVFAAGAHGALLEKLRRQPVTLKDVTARIFQGVKTSADKIFIVEELKRSAQQVLVRSPKDGAEYWLEGELLHPLVKGGDSHPYHLERTSRLILFPYASSGKQGVTLLSRAELEARYPKTWQYLSVHRSYLENREKGRFRGAHWYQFGRSQALDVMPLAKIFTPDLAPRASFALDESGGIFFTGGVAGGYGLLVKEGLSVKYLIALLNSNLLNWVIVQIGTKMRGGYLSFESRFIKSLPISPEGDAPTETKRRLMGLVDRMLATSSHLYSSVSDEDTLTLQNAYRVLDKEINALVYELYGLTEAEIALVEDAATL